MNEKLRVNKEIEGVLLRYKAGETNDRKHTRKLILSIKGLVVLSDNQKLPDNPKPNPPDDSEEIVAFAAYGQAQQDMKDWRRIVK